MTKLKWLDDGNFDLEVDDETKKADLLRGIRFLILSLRVYLNNDNSLTDEEREELWKFIVGDIADGVIEIGKISKNNL